MNKEHKLRISEEDLNSELGWVDEAKLIEHNKEVDKLCFGGEELYRAGGSRWFNTPMTQTRKLNRAGRRAQKRAGR